MLNPLANGKIQGLFKAFECFTSTFQGKFYFQGLFKTVLNIQVLQACANPEMTVCHIFTGAVNKSETSETRYFIG